MRKSRRSTIYLPAKIKKKECRHSSRSASLNGRENSMLDYDELKTAFEALGLANTPVIAHASLQPFGYIQNGADTVLQALLDSVKSLLMPTFTYKTMITPEVGPPNNGI